MNGGDIGMWYWDVGSGYFEISGYWMEGLNLTASDFDADIAEFRKRLHPDETVFWTIDDARSLAPDEPYDRQFRVRDSNDEYRWVQALGRATAHGEDGAPETISGIFIDITDRKQGELRAVGMAQIIEESYNEVYITDAETQRFIEVNRGARENLGYTLEELRGMSASDIIPEMDDDSWNEVLQPISRGASRVEFETVHQRKDGAAYPILMSIQQARLMDREVVVAIGLDLTQRRQLEDQLAQAQRLESIGSLAAGVAHEMNTPLQYVSNNIRFLHDCVESLFEVFDAQAHALDPNGPKKSWESRRDEALALAERTRFSRVRDEFPGAIEESLEGVDRVLQIVRAMKEFSHPGSTEKGPVDINSAISSTVTVTKNRWKEAADLVLELDPGLPAVRCQGGSINQVFVNLIVNAADAILDRREKDPSAPAGKITIRSAQDGPNAVFEVEDNGCGMPEDVKRRAFEQFYTTKEVGKGTGQGLSLCHAIVTRNHDGEIEIDSEPGEGTTVRIRLPFALQEGGEAGDAPSSETLLAAAN